MGLIRLDIHSVRNIQKQTLQPCPAVNFLIGENASGKSSFIEAIYILGRAKSFRSASIKTVITTGQDHLIVTAQTAHADGVSHLGIKLDGKNFAIRVDKQTKQKRSDLAYALPLQLIHPKSYELLDAGPQLRREFLDWGVFNSDEQFLPAWRKFKKALSQRNALLKSRSVRQLNVWDKELLNYGTIVNVCRQQYLEKFKPVFLSIANQFLSVDNIDINFFPGWNTGLPLLQILQDDVEKDLRYGFTRSGPHRADFYLMVSERLARDFVSRGQAKLLVLSLKLAQVQLLLNEKSDAGCILIDDFAAELDVFNRAKLLAYLAAMQCQVFITATNKTDLGDLSQLDSYKMFHVEQGHINPL
ncbi:MAG: DNA replication/repair protein RecF [Methylococcaceae bacterium]|jgi:DNA replication and repair protein RecF